MYIGIAGQEKGTCVNDCDAYQYALEQMQWDEELQKEFGEKFIIFPNPMYGSWESTVYNGNKLDAKGQTEERQKNLQGFDK